MNPPDTTLPTDVPPAIDENYNPLAIGYQQVALPDLSPDEKGYLVNGQFYASVRMARGQGADRHVFSVTACAFARDYDGKPYVNAAGLTMEGHFTASCDKTELVADATAADRVKAAALDGALREMLALIAENVAFESMSL